MKILTNNKLDNLLRNEWSKGFDDGKQYVYKSPLAMNNYNEGFKAGLKQQQEDIKFMFELFETPEEFCDWVYEKFVKGE